MKNSKEKEQQNDNSVENKTTSPTCYESAEGIIKQILDKMIISVVRSIQMKEVDEQMGIFCFNNLKVQMTSLFETSFINYTDDMTHEEPQLLWDFIPPPENTWVELPEPESQDMDRYESSNINYVEIKKDQDKELPSSTTTTGTKNEINILERNNRKKTGTGKKESEPLYLNNNNIISEVEEKSSISGFDG